MLWSGWPRADARCLPSSSSANPAVPVLPSQRSAALPLLSSPLRSFPKSFPCDIHHQNTLTGRAWYPPGAGSLLTTRATLLMTSLAVTIYDNANAIISIKTMLVRYFSLYLAPVFLGTSQAHGKGKSQFQEGAWRDTWGVTGMKLKHAEIKRLVPKHARHTVLRQELSHQIIFPPHWSFCPRDALLLSACVLQ